MIIIRESAKILSSAPLRHGYFYNCYSSGAESINKPRPHDSGDYYWARKSQCGGFWLIIYQGKTIEEVSVMIRCDVKNFIAGKLADLNGGISAA